MEAEREMNDFDLPKKSTMLEKSVCRVAYKVGDKQSTETGWLCSEDGWIITAGHIFVEDGERYSREEGVIQGAVLVKFPDLDEMPVQVLYAEKRNQEGIDFAVLSLTRRPSGMIPFCVNLDGRNQTGEIRIIGMGKILQGFLAPVRGYIEGSLVDVECGADSFLHISAENAVQPGYSGAPVFSVEDNAVIAIQVMASKSGQEPNAYTPVAERKTVNAVMLRRMIERYPELEQHLIALKRPFSGFDILTAIRNHRGGKRISGQHFSEETIDETILPMIQEQELRHDKIKDLSQPVLDAIHKAHDKNCFVLGEEGGSGKTMTLLKLFSYSLKLNTVRKIPLYIELRNLPIRTERYNVYDDPGMLFADYLASELYGSYLSKGRIAADRDDMREKFREELEEPSFRGTKYLLLLDGLNEVSLARRPEVCEEILFWARNPHTQVIVTSRYKEDMLVKGSAKKSDFSSFEDFFIEDRQLWDVNDSQEQFLLLTIQKLKKQVVSDYLSNNGIGEKIIGEVMNNQELLDILRIPMYLTIFARLYNIKAQARKISSGGRLMDVCTRGELLYEFFGEKEAQITRTVDVQKDKLEKKDNIENRKKIFMFEKIIPYVAFHMAAVQSYSISEDDLLELLDNLLTEEDSVMKKRASFIKSYRTIYELYYDRSNLSGRGEVDTRYSASEEIIRFIVEELHIMKKIHVIRECKMSDMGIKDINVIMYEFLHENLRDYFAARQLQEDVSCFIYLNVSEGLSLAQRNIPHTVLEFFGDICHEHESKPVCDNKSRQWVIRHTSFIKNALGLLRGRHDEDARVMVSNIISVMQYSRKNDLSGLDLQDIDFTETWLGGIRFSRFYGNTYLSSIFDRATIHSFNLLRNGHDTVVTCVRRDRRNRDIIYSADMSGRVIRWDCERKRGSDICQLDENIRDMLVSSESENIIYIASEHSIYRLALSDLTISKVYETKAFLWNLRLSESGISFKTDMNPSVWIRLIIDEDGRLCQVIGDEYSMPFWLVSHSCESRDGTWLIAGGSSKNHRVQVFHREKNEDWNRIPVQTVPFHYGNRMRWMEMSVDETRILFCVQNYLYEYSLTGGMLDSEIFRLYSVSEIAFASYWYNDDGSLDGILYSCGSEIILLDRNYKISMRLNSGNGVCHYASPFLIDHDYRFSRQSGLQRGVQEKYHLYMDGEIQEFDADTNICNRIYDIKKRSKLGYCLNDHKVRLFQTNLYSVNLQSAQIEDTSSENIQFIDYAEMRDSVGFRIQRLGQRIIVYDRYTEEQESFRAYRGLLIQGCSMKDIKGDMQEPENQEILRRYGAILKEH